MEANLPLITETAGVATCRTFTGYERYFLDRLRGARANPYLDGMPLAVATHFAEALGLTRMGYRGPLREVGEDLLHEAGEAGFEVLRTGPEAFAAELHRLQSDPLQSNTSHKLGLGPLLK